MKKFFVPSKWEEKTDALKFKTIKGNLNAGSAAAETKKQSKKSRNKNNQAPAKTAKAKGPLAPTPPPTTPKIKSGRIDKKDKKNKQKLQLSPAAIKAAVNSIKDVPQSHKTNDSTTSALQAKLKEQLVGGRFRFINEQLYTMDSMKAQQLFQKDREAFEAYHTGYRHQVKKWPCNPLNRIIKMVKKLPTSLEVGDFGCGEGQLAKSVPHKVHSMDLVSCRKDIIACDMASTPLPAQTLDVAVYCLSLMGTNLNDYLLEANRVLKIGGFVYVAEIQSRFDDVKSFVKAFEGCGFELLKKDVSVQLFYFFQFKKVRHVGRVALLQPFSLKPCLYRKR